MTVVKSNTTVNKNKTVTFASRGGRGAARHTRMDRDKVRVVLHLVDPVQAPGRDDRLGHTLCVRLCQHVSVYLLHIRGASNAWRTCQYTVLDTPCVCAKNKKRRWGMTEASHSSVAWRSSHSKSRLLRAIPPKTGVLAPECHAPVVEACCGVGFGVENLLCM